MSLKTFWHKLGSPRWFYDISRGWIVVFGVLALLLLSIGAIWGLAFAPPDYQQGNSYRIMFVHVPTAMVAQSVYLGMGVAGFVLFVWRMKIADVAISACLPLGIFLTALALFTGSVWGRPTWGTWWDWDGRTVSTLVLFFLYVGIFALRGAIADSDLRGRASALVAMVGTINIPIIKYSVDWWQTLHQTSSFTLTEKPAMPAEMWLPLLVMVLGLYFFAGFAVLHRMRTEVLVRERNTQWVAQLFSGERRAV
ncbi:MAG: heme ABC transporter permease [Pseudomonadales bacterium]|nr:heme ABC transporter permease [Pseudomonadales bacterium]